MRAGPRSEQTPLTLAVVEVLNHRLEASSVGSVHRLAKVVQSISRSQLYLLMRGQAVIDLAELFAICEALGVRPRQVMAEAEGRVGATGGGLAIAAYDEVHPIEAEQGVAEDA